MFRFLISFLSIIIFVTVASAQPEVEWFRTYHADDYDSFWDVYAPNDGGYVMCGKRHHTNQAFHPGTEMWVVRIDENSNPLWTGLYGNFEDYDEGNTIIEVDGGGFLVGGTTGRYPDGNHQVAAWRLDENGEQVWFRAYGRGICHAVIELKAGEFLLTGGTYGGGRGFLKCINGDGELLWEEFYVPGAFRGMRETQGGVVMAGNNANANIIVVKASTEQEGEVLWSNEHSPYTENHIYSIVSGHDDGFILSGRNLTIELDENRLNNFLVCKIDDEGNLAWARDFNLTERWDFEISYCLAKYPRNGYILVGDAGSHVDGGVIRISSDAESRWERIYDQFRDPGNELVFSLATLKSVITEDDGSVVAVGTGVARQGRNNDGIVIKFLPEMLEPHFISYIPEDTLLTTLQGDTIQFIVHAVDDQEDPVDFLWIMGEDTLSTDSTTTIIFEEMGEFDVQCQITDGEFTPTIIWHITVTDFVIRDFSPDETELSIRRNSEIEFNLSAEALAEPDITYEWLLFDRNDQRHELGNEQSVSTQFDLTGNNRLEGWALHGEDSKSVVWSIDVNSIIWWWWPHEFDLTVHPDTTMTFEVFPFNDNSDSLEYAWYLNDEAVEGEEASIDILFNEIGEFTIAAYISEGIEADTIRWTVDVQELSCATDKLDLVGLPSTPVLYQSIPNPFNSTTTIRYYLPESSIIDLQLFNIQGRLVQTLFSENTTSGYHLFVLKANNLSSGIYFLNLKGDYFNRIQKVILIR